nr:YceK/YidQ family lipoprotein [Pseudomonas sp. SSM44]
MPPPGLNNSSSEAHGATVMCWMMVVCPLITVVSLPLDVAIDTLLLPVDALSDRDDKKTDQ